MKILVLPGDGIGPEITAATLHVLRAVDSRLGLGLEVQQRDIGLAALAAHGTTLPDVVLQQVTEVDGTVLGPVSHYDYPPREQGGINPSAELRTRSTWPPTSVPAGRSRGSACCARRWTSSSCARTPRASTPTAACMPSGEFMPDPDSAFSIRKVTARASERVARAAFELAVTRRRHVTAVHKANVLTLSDGLFLRVVREVAADYADVELRELIIDAAAARLIRDPGSFDVVVTTNMFGDILSDEASELCGSLGLGGAVNAGDDICVAQAQHGSAPTSPGRAWPTPRSSSRQACSSTGTAPARTARAA